MGGAGHLQDSPGINIETNIHQATTGTKIRPGNAMIDLCVLGNRDITPPPVWNKGGSRQYPPESARSRSGRNAGSGEGAITRKSTMSYGITGRKFWRELWQELVPRYKLKHVMVSGAIAYANRPNR